MTIKEIEEEAQNCIGKLMGEPVKLTGFRHYIDNGEKKVLIEVTVVKEQPKEVGLV